MPTRKKYLTVDPYEMSSDRQTKKPANKLNLLFATVQCRYNKNKSAINNITYVVNG